MRNIRKLLKRHIMLYYAGIGSRETPIEIQRTMTAVAQLLAKRKWILRSGAAIGADQAFETGAGKRVEIMLPWNEYNNSPAGFQGIPKQALKLAEEHHPNWRACSDRARKLHARNMQILLGIELTTPCKFVLCWTKDGNDTGGTGQAIRAAGAYGIPVINMYHEDWRLAVYKYFDTIKIGRVGKTSPGYVPVYCGRPGKGKPGLLGNPYAAKVTHGNRDEVCNIFQEYLNLVIANKGNVGTINGHSAEHLYKELRKLWKMWDAGTAIELQCFCAPKRCHTESIRKFLYNL